ncbi:unnamed protein product [Mesocestoides corti]|uniref:Uncharacterized protein n=1 Tax=Mesocestoides corti TaxID=53468 RepID=A0A0R3UBH9_MESCO|nr:unnamed protein product [Mesocestoides corti]
MVEEVVKLLYFEFESLVPGTEQGGAFSKHPLEILNGCFESEVNRGLGEDRVSVCLQFGWMQFAGKESDLPCVVLGRKINSKQVFVRLIIGLERYPFSGS